MNDYCLESAHQRIYNTITKNQFSEVIKSYNSQNYRSATVMLWSVVVCDLVYKLQELETVYKDPGAASILEYIKSEQESKPTSSEWEMEIFKRANKSTGLISLKLQADLEYMQKNRHCCAHPVMTSEYKLYTPSKDLVRSFIRLALEELLTKSPIMHTKSFNSFLADANSIYPQMEYEQKRYFRYLDNKYFSRLDRVGIQYYFKTLWKFVFTLENEQCDLHRYNNYLILLHLFAENRELLTTIIQEEQHHFSNISNNDPIKKLLVDFLSKHTHVFKLLNDTAKVQIETCSNTYASCLIISWFLSKSLPEHIEYFIDKYSELYMTGFEDSFKEFWNKCTEEGIQSEAIALANYMLSKSSSYTETKIILNGAIRDYINEYSIDQITSLIEGINSNDQVYGYAYASSYFSIIKEKCDQLDSSFDYSKYPNFIS